MTIRRVLVPGRGEGATLVLHAPISLWGGIDPVRGTIADPRHPQFGESVAGRILVLDRVIGSSSGSSVMLELMSRGLAPAGVVLRQVDAILTLGVVVGRAMDFGTLPVVLADFEEAEIPAELVLDV